MASDPVNSRSVDALSSQIDVVRARLSSLNSNLGHSSIDRMAGVDFGNSNGHNTFAGGANNNSADFGSPPPLTMGAHKRYKGLLDRTVGGGTSSSPVPPPSAERTAFDAGTSAQHQRQVAAAHADSRWQMQQDMLSRQLDEFRRGGGELDAATPFEAAAAAGGAGRGLDAFADMQKRLRSKLTAMGSGALSPAPGVDAQRRREIEEDDARQYEAEQRRQQLQAASPESPRNAAPPRPAGIPVQSTSGRTAADVGVAGEDVMLANRTDAAGGANMREAYAGASGQVRGGGGAQGLQTAGRFQSPSLIGGLVGRFNQQGNDSAASDAEPNAGASPRSGTPARRASSSATFAAAHGAAPSAAAPATPSAAVQQHQQQQLAASAVGSQEVDLSGAEVFAILRMRGIVVSRGQTGEHLLPAATCHRMALSAAELQQLNQLRESLRRQARNSPRGASAAGRASPRASTPSLRSTEAAMAVAEPAARTRTANNTTATARRTAAASRSALSPAASSRATAARRSGTPSDAVASPPRQAARWR
jgi:hypothetical protein